MTDPTVPTPTQPADPRVTELARVLYAAGVYCGECGYTGCDDCHRHAETLAAAVLASDAFVYVPNHRAAETCPHGCSRVDPYGFVPSAGCPTHDAPSPAVPGPDQAAAAMEWRERIGVDVMHAMRCTHEGDDFGDRAVCATCYDNAQRVGKLVEREVAPLVAELDRLRAKRANPVSIERFLDFGVEILLARGVTACRSDVGRLLDAYAAALAGPDDTAHPDTEEGR